MAKLIDTHFHLDIYKNHAQVFRYLNENKIYTLCMTNSPGVYISCQKLYGYDKYVKFAMGFHPLEKNLCEKDLNDFCGCWIPPSTLEKSGLIILKKVRRGETFKREALRK